MTARQKNVVLHLDIDWKKIAIKYNIKKLFLKSNLNLTDGLKSYSSDSN